jgi:thiol-disulfide isomerase/thioredoxin
MTKSPDSEPERGKLDPKPTTLAPEAQSAADPSDPGWWKNPRTWLLILLAGAVVGPLLFRSSGPEVGVDAAPFELPLLGQKGASYALSSPPRAPVVLEAFAPWCGACERSASAVDAAAQRAQQRGVDFVAVAVDSSLSEVERVKRDWELDVDIALDDGRFASLYQIRVLPTFVVIDAQGKVRQVKSGALSQSQLELWIDELSVDR